MSTTPTVYSFSPEIRKAYERLKFPFAVYQYVEGEIHLLLASDGFCQMKNKSREELKSFRTEAIYRNVHPQDLDQVVELGEAFVRSRKPYDVVYRSRNAFDHTYHVIHAVGNFQTMEDGSHLAFMKYSDLTLSMSCAEKLVPSPEETMENRYLMDVVTELPNINYFHRFSGEFISGIREAGETPVCIYLDVDGMRFYNEEFGFRAGDKLLKTVGTILQEHFPDSLVCRIGDDHFSVITGWNDHVVDCLEDARGCVERSALGSATSFRAGLAMMGEENGEAIRALDRARFAAKSMAPGADKHCMMYSQDIDDKYWQERYIREKFGEALKKEWIRVFYQGIVRTTTLKVCSFEALARWIDPEKGMLSPAEFIPVLEKHHLIHQLDVYMLEKVISQVRVREEGGLPIVPVSVNLTGQDFDSENMVKVILELLERYQVEPRLLIIEITERDVANATASFQRQIAELRRNGIQVWVDDFGSGYSALNVLSQYKFDMIKLDMQFLRTLDENNGANRIIIKALTEAAEKLGIRTLAEGVENTEQHQFLVEAGCDREQGFLFARPRALEESLYRAGHHQPILLCETREEAELFD